MRSMLVIGLGRFGENLAMKLAELGNEVMVVDRHEENVDKIAPFVTSAVVGDCMDPAVLDALGVASFDVCFVCMGNNFQNSLQITSLLKEMGAKKVCSRRPFFLTLLLFYAFEDNISEEYQSENPCYYRNFFSLLCSCLTDYE